MLKTVILALIAATPATAQTTLPHVLGDHMLFQRNAPIRVWGRSQPGDSITVELSQSRATTKAAPDGTWTATLPPLKEGGPYSLRVAGPTNILTLNDILIGDLYLAAGQSNVGITMREWARKLGNSPATAAVLAAATHPDIRLMVAPKSKSDTPQTDFDPAHPWIAASPDSVQNFSALGYLFARDINAAEHVPIGVIDASWGETSAEAWTSLPSLKADQALASVFTAYTDAMQKKFNPHRTPPAGAYNSMINPILPLRLRGVVWFQGSNNAHPAQYPIYNKVFPALITDWRRNFAQGDLPFLFVQVSVNDGPGNEKSWPVLREAQRETLKLPNTAMTVSIDVGDPKDNHAVSKEVLSHRLALAARALIYGEKLEYSGPLFHSATPSASGMRVAFDHAGSGLLAHGDLAGFEVAAADHAFVPATAVIEGPTLLVSAPSVPNPTFVRYGWSATPAATLWNRDDLPASPFTSEPAQ